MRWIVTDNIYRETWRQLLEFSNVELAYDAIVGVHGEPKSQNTKHNYLKQATQVRVCILQAKEYFDAAKVSTLFTSPNHTYYGAVALASAILLIKGDGTKSLDFLKSDPANNHHGLNMTTGSNASSAAKGVSLLEQTFVEILPRGHFINWYSVLPARGNVYGLSHIHSANGSNTSYSPVGGYNSPAPEQLVGKKFTALQLLKYFPDLGPELQRFGIYVARSRVSQEAHMYPNQQTTHTWRIHGAASVVNRDALLEKFSINSNFADALAFKGDDGGTSGIVTLTLKLPLGEHVNINWPHSRDTLNHDQIIYSDSPETHEIADLYLVAYQLSMLSRYYPDIWVGCIESQCRGAKLIDLAADVIHRKLPILALSLLSSQDVIISSHREPWKN